MELSFDYYAKDLNGENMNYAGADLHLGKTLAAFLGNSTTCDDPIKFYDWAKQLYATGKINVDRSDFNKLKKFVEDITNTSAIVKAQLLSCFLLTPEGL